MNGLHGKRNFTILIILFVIGLIMIYKPYQVKARIVSRYNEILVEKLTYSTSAEARIQARQALIQVEREEIFRYKAKEAAEEKHEHEKEVEQRKHEHENEFEEMSNVEVSDVKEEEHDISKHDHSGDFFHTDYFGESWRTWTNSYRIWVIARNTYLIFFLMAILKAYVEDLKKKK
ncbi:MAG: hypothetical protein ACLFQV_00495 [Vulcanimicrobiota bacterium]